MTDISISNIDVVSDISILYGADDHMLQIYMDLGVGNENEPVAPKTKLVLVLFLGNVRIIINTLHFSRNLIPKIPFQSFGTENHMMS